MFTVLPAILFHLLYILLPKYYQLVLPRFDVTRGYQK